MNYSRLARVTLPILAALVLVTLAPGKVYAQAGEPDLALFPLITGLFGGLAIFLFGLEQASDSLRAVAGSRMRTILNRLITNRFMGVLTGFAVTAIVQSSSVTTVMLVSFITAGLLSFSQAVSVILGAHIGTTIAVQVIAFKITEYALLLVTVGFAGLFLLKGSKRRYGAWLLGIGLIFLGMEIMSQSMEPLKDYPPFLSLMATLNNPWASLIAAALFTALVQASAATLGVAIVFASQGLIGLEAGVAMILGANIGTCVLAAVAAVGKPSEAVRAAVVHIIFKITGALIALPFIPLLAQAAIAISPRAPIDPTGIVLETQTIARQIANAHTIFNVTIVMLFLPFSPLFARFVEWLVPDREDLAEHAMSMPRYLDSSLLDTPSLALGMVRREVSRMADVLEEMLADIPDAVFHGNLERMQQVQALDEHVDDLFAAITRYLAKINQEDLSEDTADEVLAAMSALTELEAIGDIIENNLNHLANVRVTNNVHLDPESLQALSKYHSQVSKAFRSAVVAFVSDNREIAKMVMGMKEEINQMDIQTRAWQALLLRETLTPQEMASYTLQMDIMDNLKRIYYHVKRVAKLVVHEEGAADWAKVRLAGAGGD
jgi:phosphate:Na+ symporter